MPRICAHCTAGGGAIGSIVHAYDGDLTEHVQSVSGINEDGSAVGGKTSLGKKAQRSKGAYIDPVEGATTADVGKTILYHRINKPELASLVADKKSEGETSDEKAWASLLDGALRHSMREGVKQHLTRREQFIWRLGAYNFVAWMIANDLTDPTGTWAKVDTGVYLFAQAAKKIEADLKTKRYGIKTKPRLSVISSSSQIDRYAAVNAMSHVPGLIRARK